MQRGIMAVCLSLSAVPPFTKPSLPKIRDGQRYYTATEKKTTADEVLDDLAGAGRRPAAQAPGRAEACRIGRSHTFSPGQDRGFSFGCSTLCGSSLRAGFQKC